VPDILVNNAGINIPQQFLDVDVATFDRIFSVNIRGAFFVAQAAARRMREARRRGAIVNITSQAGHVGLIRRTVYCASKYALEGLTKAMAIELAPDIRVNAVAPTFIETPMTKPFLEEPAFKAYVDSNLLVEGVGTTRDVAAAVLYVASPAARLMTGASLLIDGGWTAH
jgi:NAD(P)-dependent dehydrogenase (short-subunit alcohol dehydrogenase family)